MSFNDKGSNKAEAILTKERKCRAFTPSNFEAHNNSVV